MSRDLLAPGAFIISPQLLQLPCVIGCYLEAFDGEAAVQQIGDLLVQKALMLFFLAGFGFLQLPIYPDQLVQLVNALLQLDFASGQNILLDSPGSLLFVMGDLQLIQQILILHLRAGILDRVLIGVTVADGLEGLAKGLQLLQRRLGQLLQVITLFIDLGLQLLCRLPYVDRIRGSGEGEKIVLQEQSDIGVQFAHFPAFGRLFLDGVHECLIIFPGFLIRQPTSHIRHQLAILQREGHKRLGAIYIILRFEELLQLTRVVMIQQPFLLGEILFLQLGLTLPGPLLQVRIELLFLNLLGFLP